MAINTEFEFGQLTAPNLSTLRLLIRLHWLECLAQLITLLAAAFWWQIDLPFTALATIVGLFAAWNLWSTWSIHRRASDYGSERSAFTQLGVETTVLAGILYFTGGATNPFVSLFLVPLSIGAIILRPLLAVEIGLLCSGAYTLLLFFHVPLQIQHTNGEVGFNLHVIGMWANFMVSTVVVLVLLSTIVGLARLRAEKISELREQAIRNQHVIAIGGLAAGAAHSLSTPLSTVAIVLDELTDGAKLSCVHNSNIALAKIQLSSCRDRLSEILSAAKVERLDSTTVQVAWDYVEKVGKRWILLRPDMDLQLDNQLTDTQMAVDETIGHCLTTLLDNAADANDANHTRRIEMRAFTHMNEIVIEVEDNGGNPGATLEAIGEHIVSTKPNGSGAGLVIARSNLNRLGGQLLFEAGVQGHVARMIFPMDFQKPNYFASEQT